MVIFKCCELGYKLHISDVVIAEVLKRHNNTAISMITRAHGTCFRLKKGARSLLERHVEEQVAISNTDIWVHQ
jgi:hypothetical protein